MHLHDGHPPRDALGTRRVSATRAHGRSETRLPVPPCPRSPGTGEDRGCQCPPSPPLPPLLCLSPSSGPMRCGSSPHRAPAPHLPEERRVRPPPRNSFWRRLCPGEARAQRTKGVVCCTHQVGDTSHCCLPTPTRAEGTEGGRLPGAGEGTAGDGGAGAGPEPCLTPCPRGQKRISTRRRVATPGPLPRKQALLPCKSRSTRQLRAGGYHSQRRSKEAAGSTINQNRAPAPHLFPSLKPGRASGE